MTEEQRQSLRALVKADSLFSARDGWNLMGLHFTVGAEQRKNARRLGTRTAKNANRDTEIMQLHERGLSYGQIAKRVQHLEPGISRDTVRKVIERRKKGAHQRNGHTQAD
jgi:DNA-binding NarL/FixJ family response regulator